MTGMFGGGRACPSLVALLLLVGLPACETAAAADKLSEREAGIVARGVEVYQAQRCGACHSLGRAGTTGIFGPPHDSLVIHAAERIRDPDYQGTATSAEEYIRESIEKPGAYRVPGFERTHFAMPVYTGIPPEDLDALVFMLSRPPE